MCLSSNGGGYGSAEDRDKDAAAWDLKNGHVTGEKKQGRCSARLYPKANHTAYLCEVPYWVILLLRSGRKSSVWCPSCMLRAGMVGPAALWRTFISQFKVLSKRPSNVLPAPMTEISIGRMGAKYDIAVVHESVAQCSFEGPNNSFSYLVFNVVTAWRWE